MFMLRGAIYIDPEFSWKYEVGPAGTAFVAGTALGPEYDGTLWIGSARSFQQVADRVADNTAKFGATESESLLIGKGFGITPDIEQGPDGNLCVVSVSGGTVYKISRSN